MNTKCITLAILLSMAYCADAQIKKGATFLGGNVSFTTEKGTSNNNSNDYQRSGVYILPVYGKAIKENRVAGVDLLFYYQKNDVAQDVNDLKEWIVGAGFFLREYKPLGKTKASIFLQARLGGQYDHVESAFNTPNESDTKSFLLGISMYPGISYGISRKLQLETGFINLFGINYTHKKTATGTVSPVSVNSNGFNIYANLENLTRFSVGFRLLINRP